MNTTRNLSIAIFLLILTATACSIKGVTGETGIAECDKLFAKVEEKTADKNFNANSPRGAAYKFLKDDIVKPLRSEMNKPNADRKELAGQCRTAYDNFVPEADR